MFEIFPWNAHLETGIDAIDNQHRRLVQLINRLAQHHVQGATQAEVEVILGELADYADYHFKTEETIWQTALAKDDWLTQHVASHQKFFDHIVALRSGQRPFQAVLDDLFAYLTQWLAYHILDNDKRMALAVKAIEAGNSVADARLAADEQMRGATATLIQTVLAMYQTVSAQAIELMHEKLERQQTQQALQASEARWTALLSDAVQKPQQWSLAEQRMHAVLDKVPAGLAAANIHTGRFVFVNEYFCQLLGYSRDDALQLTPARIHPPETLPRIEADFARINAGNPPGPMELPVLRRDGSQFVADIQRIPLEIGGEPALLGIFTDISARLQANQALADSESHLRTLVDTIPDLIWLKDTQGVYLSCNPSFERFFGATEAAIVGKTDHDFVDAELAASFRHHDQAAMAAQKPTVNEEWVTFASDGHRVLLETTKVPMLGADGRILGVLGISHDMTEQRRMQDELAMHRQHLETLVATRTAELQAANHRLSLSDERLTAMLAISQSMSHLTEAQLLQRGADVAVRITASQTGYASLATPAVCTATLPGQCCVPIDDNGQCVLQLCISGKAGAYTHGDTEQVRQVGHDLWALLRRHRTEHALAEAKDAAEAASRTKSAFLSNMSHEIRTPLNAIIGFAHVLARDDTLSSLQLDQARIIVQSGQHLLDLINDVLDISKIEAGKLTLTPTDFRLHDMLAELALMFGMRAEAKGLHMTHQLQPDVPDEVCADESKLRQVLINLLGNAIKFTAQGQISLRASLVPMPADAPDDASTLNLRLEIEDTGPGIGLQEQQRLFKPFEQTQAGHHSGGTGLGLSISKRLVELMGGRIGLNSQPGQGSVFYVEIPINRATQTPQRRTSQWSGVTGLAPGSPVVRLLVTDDMPDNRRLLQDVLRPLGFELMPASNGQEALALLDAWQPHAVLMDMRMPVMDGFEATRRIKALPDNQRVPVIAVTASAFDDDMKAVFACGVDAYVRKPVRTEELLETLAQVLGLRYAYGKAVPPASPPQRLTSARDLASLPAELRHSMYQAVHAGDMTRLLAQVATVANLDAALAAGLRNLADDYQYEQLEALLAPNTPLPPDGNL